MKYQIFLLFLLVACTPQEEYPQSPCEIIHTGSEHAPVIIFYNDGLNETYFDEVVGNATSYLEESVWHEVDFGRYVIRNASEDICQAENENSIAPHLACDKEAIRPLLQSCGELSIIVFAFTNEYVKPQGTVTYGGNSLISMFPNIFLDRTEFLHEMGHSVGLRDEYVRGVKVAGAAGQPGPNCLPNGTAQQVWGENVEAGCAGNPEWYHPADSGQIMRAQHGDHSQYGPTNEKYIRDVIHCCYAENRTAYSCDEFFKTYPQWNACRQ